MSHLATKVGAHDDRRFQEAYWHVFEAFFGPQNARVLKATLLAKVDRADTGTTEVDRVCFGLRQSMGWVAEAIEKKALAEARASEGERVTPA
jgi:hypothetical protein